MQRAKRHTQLPWWEDRIRLLLGGLIAMAAILSWRYFTLQVVQHGVYAALAEDQHQLSQQLSPKRGEILVADHQSATGSYPLVTNRTLFLLYAVPKQIHQPAEATERLAPFVLTDRVELLGRLSKSNDLYEPIQHNLTEDQKKTITDLNIPGLYFSEEQTRYYPEKNIGSQLTGFVGFDGDRQVGRYGLEGYYEKELAGSKGYIKAQKDASGQLIATAAQFWQPAINGSTLQLTIDRTIEFEACRQLDQAVQKHGADSGSIVIMRPDTGAIVALCGSPDFDPNSYRTVANIRTFTNPATQIPYEPGSVFKAITMAAALNEKKVTPESTYVDTGELKIGSFTIRNSDSKAHGRQTMNQVLEESLNTGAMYAMHTIGPKIFDQYVRNFGFGQPTGVDLDESSGNISALKTHKDIYASTGSFGQGITTTPLQLAVSYAALANGGKIVQPYVVDKVIRPDGTAIVTKPRVIRQVISPQTSATISAMLVRVVQKGHGQKAGVPGYYVAGKTGTAQVPDPKTGKYFQNTTIGTFAGFAPVDDPKFVMVVQIVRPRDVQFAESSAAPLFGTLAKFMLLYDQIPPTDAKSLSAQP